MQQIMFIVFCFKGEDAKLMVGGVYDDRELAKACAQAEANFYRQPASVSECVLNQRLEHAESWGFPVEWFWPEQKA